jgi:hypothetical protein
MEYNYKSTDTFHEIWNEYQTRKLMLVCTDTGAYKSQHDNADVIDFGFLRYNAV